MKVVFTGPAINGNGHSVLRATLAYACLQKGNLRVQNSVQRDTDILVASRKDTVKAKKASDAGLAVFTYPEFIARFLKGIDTPTGGKPAKYVDAVSLDLLVPDFTDGAAIMALDVL